MVRFKTLWNNHVGSRGYVCDRITFKNQCAMRMGEALENSGISLKKFSLKRCSDCSAKFKSHIPGHIRSAQELANVFYRRPSLLGAGVKKFIFSGNVNDNIGFFKNKKGMIFIMNGWDTTDHIDLWDGASMKLKGSSNTNAYRKRGKQVWFWDVT